MLKKKWIILAAGILAAGVTYFFSRNETKKYRSIAQISTGFTISDGIQVGNETSNLYEADTKFNNVIVTATSPSVLSLLSYAVMLHDLQDPQPFRVLKENQKQDPIYRSVSKENAIRVLTDKLNTKSMLTSSKPAEKELIEYLKLYGYYYKTLGNELAVYRMQRTDYLQIDYTSDNAELSAFVVNNLFQHFLLYYRGVRSINNQQSIDTLRSLMERRKQELDIKNELLATNGTSIDNGLGSTTTTGLISNLEQALTSEKARQTLLYSDLKKVNQRLGPISSAAASKNPVTTLDNNEVLILRNAMNEAYKEFLNTGSKDQVLLTKYNDLKAQYQSKVLDPATPQKYLESGTNNQAELTAKKGDLEIDIAATNSNILRLQRQINDLKGNVRTEASQGVTTDVLLKEADLANKEYLAAKEKYNNAIDVNTSSINNFRQILYGQPAIEPEPSKRKLLIGLAGVSAIIVTMLIFVLVAYLDNSVKTPAIFAKVVNLKLISMVNFMALKNRNLADIIVRKENGGDHYDKTRLNVFRESLRKLRYEIEKTNKKVFLFASTQKGEGKTTLIQALSYSLSLSKKKILIIDTNFSNNDLTIQLKAQPILEKIGSADSLGTTQFLADVIKLPTSVGDGSIFAIGSEGGDYTPSEILPRENILHHLKEMTKEYDYIFLEGPPLNDFSDAKELTQYVDGVIAVFSATHAIKQIDKESIKFFKELNGKFVGSILNKVDLENVNAS
ncbi:AAA family ATPase [Flavitalea antarctica]